MVPCRWTLELNYSKKKEDYEQLPWVECCRLQERQREQPNFHRAWRNGPEQRLLSSAIHMLKPADYLHSFSGSRFSWPSASFRVRTGAFHGFSKGIPTLMPNWRIYDGVNMLHSQLSPGLPGQKL